MLDKHIRTHTNERPFPCRECGFAFKTNSNLSKHQKSRTHLLKAQQQHAPHLPDALAILDELGSEGRREEIGSPRPIAGLQASPPTPPPQMTTTAAIMNPDSVVRFGQNRDALSRLPPPPQQQPQQHHVTVLTSASVAPAPVLPQHPDPRLLQPVVPPQPHTEPQQLVIRAVHRPGEQHQVQALQQRPAQQQQQQPVIYQVQRQQQQAATVTTLHPLVRGTAPQPTYTLPSVPLPTVLRGGGAPSVEMRVRGAVAAASEQPRLPQQPVAVQRAVPAPSSSPQLPTAPLPLVRAPRSGLPPLTVASASPPPQQPADLSKKSERIDKVISQRIDKVISQNQAIVDTMDPIWHRRYIRTNSKEGADDKQGKGKAKAPPPTTAAALVALAAASSAPPISASPPTTAPTTQKVLSSGVTAAKHVSHQEHHHHQQQQQPPLPSQLPIPLTIRQPLPQATDPAGAVQTVALIKPEMLRLSSAAAASTTALASGSRDEFQSQSQMSNYLYLLRNLKKFRNTFK